MVPLVAIFLIRFEQMTKMLLAKHNDMIPPYRTDEPVEKGSKIEGFRSIMAAPSPKLAPSCTPHRSWPPKFLTGR